MNQIPTCDPDPALGDERFDASAGCTNKTYDGLWPTPCWVREQNPSTGTYREAIYWNRGRLCDSCKRVHDRAVANHLARRAANQNN